jgi:hypothetical protein
MSIFSRALLALAILAAPFPVKAADNYTIKDGSGASRTIIAKDTGAGLLPQSIPSSPSGVPLFTTSAPGYVALQAGSSLTLSAGSAAIGSVTQGGTWSFGLSGPIPAGGNVIGGVTQSGAWSNRVQDGAGNPLTSRAAGSSRPLDVVVVDGSGVPVAFSGGGGGIASTVTANQGTAGASPWPVSLPSGQSVNVGNFPATQTVSGSVTATLSQGGSAVSTSNPIFAQITNLPSVQAISGAVTVSNFPATQAISASALPLPAGAAQDATLTARLGTLGQKAMAASAPVTIASDQPALPVSGTFFQATQPVSGSVSVSNFPATQAVSGTVTANLGTLNGAGTASNQATIIANQNSTAAGTSATNAQAIQGVTGGVPLATTIRSAGTNRSASVTTTASTLMAANTVRQGWKIKNDSAVGIWINFDATATAAAGSGNILIPAGGYLSSEPGFVETGAMSAIAVSGTAAITAREH